MSSRQAIFASKGMRHDVCLYTGWFKRNGILGGNGIDYCEKKVHITMCLIVSGYRDTAVWNSTPNSVRFLFLGLDEERSLQTKGGYTRRIARLHLDVAACIQRREDQLRRTTRDLRTRVAKCTVVDSGIWEHLLWTVTNPSFLCNKFVI